MRILLSTRGSAGHVFPLVPFGQAARRAGHDVLIVAQRQHAANVDRTGLSFALVDAAPPETWQPLLRSFSRLGIDEANAQVIGEYFARIDTAATLPGVRALVEEWRPDLILRESWEYASALAAELYEVPIVRVGLGLAEVEEESIALVAPALDAQRAALGLPVDPAGDRLRETPFFTMVPALLDDVDVPSQVRRFRGAEPVLDVGSSAPLPEWWPGNTDPLVYLSFGSVAGAAHLPYFPALYRMAIDALAPLPVRVLMTIGDGGDPAALGELPANVHVERWIPQEAVLPHAALTVSHGGYGSTLGALAHGVPMVALPLFSMDQWANAAAVARAGAGIALGADRDVRLAIDLPDARTVEGLAPAVEALLHDGATRRRAQELGAAMAAAAPVEQAIDELVALASGSRLVPRPG
ncbi:glycosyltransferase [Baekduia sp.]|jgi:UDP:flavonoid glycosyltransferase YjiC (YdhE family)|uniref:glycosyltransferase n=1 Tax=Baekduia sp. TaxID=2600305 RepID=UPI002DFBC4BA|nr:glycosyltransferase [Baekduia sp.]